MAQYSAWLCQLPINAYRNVAFWRRARISTFR